MSEPDTISVLASEVGSALEPVALALRSPQSFAALLERMGWPLNSIPAALNPMKVPAESIATLLSSGEVDLADVPQLLAAIRDLIAALNGVASQPAGSFPAGLDVAAFKSEFPRQLLDYLVVDYLFRRLGGWGHLLKLAGVLRLEDVPASASRLAFTRRTVAWEDLAKFLSDPSLVLRDAYRWAQPDFRDLTLLGNLADALEGWHIDYRFAEVDPTLFTQLTGGASNPDNVFPDALQVPLFEQNISGFGGEVGFELLIVPQTAGDPPGFAVLPYANGSFEEEVPVTDELFVHVSGSAGLDGGMAIVVRPNRPIDMLIGAGGGVPSGASASVALGIISRRPAGSEIVLIGSANGSRLRAGSIGFELGARVDSAGHNELYIETAWNNAGLIIKAGADEADSFLASLLPGDGIHADLNFTLGLSSNRGVYFSGSGGLEISLPTHIELGPIEIQSISLSVRSASDPVPAIPVTLGATIKGELGPLTAVVQNIGLTANFTFPHDNTGNLGPLNLDLAFKPPNGVGLSLDAGVVKGGGFLSFDNARGEYVGALELTFQDIIALKAIGIINTKMSDGSRGFALLILVTAEFVPIQLGFGFTLVGVGGLLAMNRRLDTEALRVGVRTGALNSILFPQDIIANIARIISDIKNIFPLAADHFVIGPMGKLGWGTPTLLSLEIGVIIDLPTPAIVIAGVLRASLPAEDLPILNLQVNFAGGIDFQKGLIWFDASLYDSHLLIYTLTGDMALRIGWGDQAIFILTVGGFHPAFNEIPPDLRGLRRLAISLLSGDNPRLSCQTYFAITSNTVQSGSRVELYAEGCGLNIYGFLGYDLLVQFNPFHFIADLEAGLALRDGTDELMGIHVHGELSGPNPFRARGEASIDLWLFSISIDFDVTWGDDAAAQIEAEVEVLPLVEAALKDDRNWLATLPANTHQNVTLKKLQLPPEQIVLNPFAVLSVSQKVVPLGLEINKFGNQKPKGTTRFELTFADGASEEVREEFAIANFQHLNDSEKLSSKSFDKMRSGLRFSVGDSLTDGREHRERCHLRAELCASETRAHYPRGTR